MKHCTYPDHEGERLLPLSAFNKQRSKRDGLRSWCRTCQSRGRSEKPESLPRRRKRKNDWQQKNPEKANKMTYRHREKLRDQVFDHYGRACACCGATENLQIDHVDGGGTAHRITLFGYRGETYMFYRWLIRQGFPPGYQTLCGPCNSSKHAGLACRLDHSQATA
jgi:hypothetical protein